MLVARSGSRASVAGRARELPGRGKGSGVEIRQQGAHVFGLRDGKVVRLEIFADREKAIESVRAAESEKHDRVG